MGGSASVMEKPSARNQDDKKPAKVTKEVEKTLQDHLVAITSAISYLKECKDFKSKDCSCHFNSIKAASSPAGLKRADCGDIIERVINLGYPSLFNAVWADLHSVDLSQGHGKSKEGEISTPHQAVANLKTFKGAWWNLTDWGDVRLIEALGEAGVTRLLVSDMEDPDLALDQLSASDSRRHLIKGSLGTIHNMVRHSEKVRKEIRTIDKCVHLFTAYSTCKILIIQAKCFLILSYILCEHEYNSLQVTDNAIGFLVGMLRESLNYKSHKTKRYGFTSTEILQGLCQIAVNDQNKVKLMDNGCLPLMVTILAKECSREEQVLASEALWRLAFVDDNRKRMRGNMNLIQEDTQLKDQCRGALWEIMEGAVNLELDINSVEDLQMPEHKMRKAAAAGGSKKLHIMISYQWDVQQRMLSLRDLLKAEGHNVWMDIDELDGDILGGMADAVENASVILVCFSQKYKESQSCRTEATYAYKQNKPIIPLMVQLNYNPDGWLGALIGTLKYYKFHDDDIDPAEFKELLGTIQLQFNADLVTPKKETVTKSAPVPSGNVVKATPPSVPTSSKVSTWSTADVQKWLDENGLGRLAPKFEEVDGELLFQMYRQLLRAPEYFHSSVSKELGLSYFQVLKFTKVLEKAV